MHNVPNVADTAPRIPDRRNGPAPAPRLDLAPLRAAVDRIYGRHIDVSTLARVLDVNRGVVHRYTREGIPETRADELAIRLGLHPGLVWGSDWWSLGAEHNEDTERVDDYEREWRERRDRINQRLRESQALIDRMQAESRGERHLRVVR